MDIMTYKEKSVYKISINQNGYIEIEAPNKEECLELFEKVTDRKIKHKIDEAIR